MSLAEVPDSEKRPVKVVSYFQFRPQESPAVATFMEDVVVPTVASLLGRWFTSALNPIQPFMSYVPVSVRGRLYTLLQIGADSMLLFPGTCSVTVHFGACSVYSCGMLSVTASVHSGACSVY